MSSSRLALVFALALVPVACRSLPSPKGNTVQTLYDGPLERAAPVDVVVAPVENNSTTQSVPLDLLRESFQRALVKRRYSPLSIEYVDQALQRAGATPDGNTGGVAEASFRPGSLGEDAVLRVIVQGWDNSLFDTHATITADIDAYMLDSSGGPELWVGRLQGKRINMTAHVHRTPTDRLLMTVGCDELAEELLAAMPARTAKPGRP